MLAPAGCPSDTDLLAFHRGDRPALARHVELCPVCRSRLAGLSREAAGGEPDTRIDRTTDLSRSPVAAPGPAASQVVTGRWEGPPRPDPSTVTGGHESAAPDRDALSTLPAGEGTGEGLREASDPAVSEFFGPYRLLGKLGEGGMGVVHRAHDPRLKRTVALKMIRPGRTSEVDRARFLAEAEAIARLEHPNIVRIYELGEVEGQPFAALEFAPGGSLDQRLKNTLPAPRSAARLMVPIARAVHAAHELKVVHRDLKPANILLTGAADAALDAATPKVTDFGLAKFLDAEDGGATGTMAVLGTPSYMSPEQAEGRTADIGPLSDVYSLGATLYDLLSGRPPFKGTTVRETLRLVVDEDPVPPRQLQSKVHRDLETICLKCLEKSPGRRYPSAAALADDLQRFLNGEPITARPVRPAERAWRWCKRKPALATLTGFSTAAAVALLVGAFWFTYAVADEQRKKEVAEQSVARERAEKKTEEVKRESAETLERVNKYHLLETRARERIVSRETGWAWNATGDVREAAGIDTAARNPTELRSALASCLAGTDIREARVLAPGFNARSLCYHPNGRWLVLAEGRIGQGLFPLSVLFVDAQTGETVRRFSFPARLVGGLTDPRPDMANHVAISPNGRWLAVGARSGAIHRWDLRERSPAAQSWVPEKAPFGQSLGCDGVAFSPDSAALYVISKLKEDGYVTRWDTTTWKQTARLKTERAVGGLEVHPHGTAVYCVGTDQFAYQLDPVTLEKKAEFARGLAGAVAISPDGRTLALFHDDRLTLWSTRRNDLAVTIREPHREDAFQSRWGQLRFSPDGRLLLATSPGDLHAYLFDVVTGRRVADWRTEPGRVEGAFDPLSRFLAIAGQNRTVVYEILGQKEHRVVAVQPFPVIAAGLSHDGNALGTTASESPRGRHTVTPQLWNLSAAGCPAPSWSGDRFGGDWPYGSVGFTPEGDTFATLHDGEVRVFNHLTRIDHLLVPPPPELHRSALAPDGRVWAVGRDVVYATRLPLERDKVVRWQNPTGRLTGLAGMVSVDAGKSRVVVGGRDGVLRLFPSVVPDDANELKTTNSFMIESRVSLDAAALAPDESAALVGTFSGKGHLVGLPEGTPLASWEAHKDSVTAVLFLDARLLATGGRDRAVRFWSRDGNTVRELWTIRTEAAVTSLGKSGDGSKLSITCDGERGAHVWDMVALAGRFEEFGIGFTTPRSWAVPRLPVPEAAPTLPDESTWPANGLRMELFADTQFQSLRSVRLDTAVNWNWGMGQPHPHVPIKFSARWSGFLKPPRPGKYEFRVTGENSLRVRLDGKVVLDAWNPERDGDVNQTFTAELTADPHELQIELLRPKVSPAFLTLNWSMSGDFPEQPVSAAYLFHSAATAKAASVPASPKPLNEIARFTAPTASEFTRLGVSRDGRLVAAGAKAGGVYVWEADGGKPVVAIADAHKGAVSAVDISPDGALLLTAGEEDGTFALRELPSGKPVARNELHKRGTLAAFAPNGKSFVTAGADKTAREWDTKAVAVGAVANLEFTPRLLSWEPGGKAILVAGEDGEQSRWNPGEGRQSPLRLGHAARAYDPEVGLFTLRNTMGNWNNCILSLHDTPTGMKRWSLPYEPWVSAVAISPDRKTLAVGFDRDRTHPASPRGMDAVWLYDLATGGETSRLAGHTKAVLDLRFAPDGKALYSAGADGTVRAWRLK